MFKNTTILSLVFSFLVTIGLTQTVVINELMSSNTITFTDEDSDFVDWLELYNAAPNAVDLSGFGLSDDRASLYKWVFPPVILQPGQGLVVFASDKDRRIWANHWETIIDRGDSWRYRVNNSSPPVTWYLPDYNDSGWLQGPSGFGYGDGDDATTVPATISLYLRKKFTIADLNNITSAMLHVDYDDGFVAYLNGIEIARRNLGTSGIVPAYDQPADTWKEAAIYQGGFPDAFTTLDIYHLLVQGENLLAIEVHNSDLGSSDLTLIPFFTLGMKTVPENPHGMPALLRSSIPGLHANFKLSTEGEEIYLTNTQNGILDSVNTGSLPQDVSIGRQPDGSNTWYLFTEPTPGQKNSTTGYAGITEPPDFSLPAGFYPETLTLQISTGSPGGVIHFTADGSAPDQTSSVYSAPVTITKHTVIRARAFVTGKMPSAIVTRTYFINEKTTLAVISLSTNPEHFWDEDSGIYVMGKNAQPDFPYFDANFWQEWEKPVHVEFFEPNGLPGFSMDAGVQITGAWSRGFPQKSLAVYARRKYGVDHITYQLFPEKPIAEFESFVLRNSGNDWNQAFMRDALITGLVGDRGIDTQAYRPVVVFINGVYWGIHDLREKVNEHFLASNHGVDPGNLDLLQGNRDVILGDGEHYQNMISFLETADISDSINYTALQSLMDIDNFINYEIAQIYCDNTDWPGNNIKYWREKTVAGIWRWILYDADFGFGLLDKNAASHNALEFATATDGPDWPNPPWSTFLLRKLLENEKFKIEFISQTADLLNANFESTHVIDRIKYLKSLVQPEMSRHLTRWGLSYTDWNNHVSYLQDFALYRPAYMKVHMISKFNLSGVARVYLNCPAGGKIRINSLSIENFPWRGTYFKGIPVKLVAQPQPGYIFVGWQVNNENNNPELTITPQSDTTFQAIFVEANSPVVINEINYNSYPTFNVEDWIEFYNRTAVSINISNWQFKDPEDIHTFIFPPGTILEPDSYLVLCSDTLLFRQGFPEIKNILGNFAFGFSGGGEQIRLLEAQGTIIDSLTYNDQAPWPPEADGHGPTLALKHPDLDNSKPENWAASADHGTPGRINDVYVKINEETSGPVSRYNLEQNYPNPFNPITTIRFQMVKSGTVSLEIFTIEGRLLNRLISKDLSAGIHQVDWQPAPDLASGIYFYRLIIKEQYQQTRKMLLLR